MHDAQMTWYGLTKNDPNSCKTIPSQIGKMRSLAYHWALQAYYPATPNQSVFSFKLLQLGTTQQVALNESMRLLQITNTKGDMLSVKNLIVSIVLYRYYRITHVYMSHDRMPAVLQR